MSRLIDHARAELTRIGAFEPSEFYKGATGAAVMELIELFSRQAHSGMSAGRVCALFARLARFEPLSPLTGEEAEWSEPIDPEGTRQNLRCSRVFRGPDGTAFDLDGKVFRTPSGTRYTNSDSRVVVTFPYTPTTEYIDVKADEAGA